MPFPEKVEAREELCRLALSEGVNRRELCRRFNIRPRILYKWLDRYRQAGVAGLLDQSRRPHRSPSQTSPEMEAAVLAVRQENPVWGGRKIWKTLERRGLVAPAPSTITGILRRKGVALVGPGKKTWKRFEHAEPNGLWQMDFKGHVEMAQSRLHPLTVVDDHSRYSVALHAADNERHLTVQNALQAAFERYGLPEIMLTDNGSPWGDRGEQTLTKLGIWLIEHGVAPWHSPPFHPQNHGKNERFNRTLKAELLEGAPSTISSRPSGPSTAGDTVTTTTDHTTHLAWRYRPIDIEPARALSRRLSSPSSMDLTISSAVSMPPHTSASRAERCALPRH
jgi:transposase InsO family protein